MAGKFRTLRRWAKIAPFTVLAIVLVLPLICLILVEGVLRWAADGAGFAANLYDRAYDWTLGQVVERRFPGVLKRRMPNG